jgi:hypothetical protein
MLARAATVYLLYAEKARVNILVATNQAIDLVFWAKVMAEAAPMSACCQDHPEHTFPPLTAANNQTRKQVI